MCRIEPEEETIRVTKPVFRRMQQCSMGKSRQQRMDRQARGLPESWRGLTGLKKLRLGGCRGMTEGWEREGWSGER